MVKDMKNAKVIIGVIILIILFSATVTSSSVLASPSIYSEDHHDSMHRSPRLVSNTSSEIILSTDYITIKIAGCKEHIAPKILFWYTPDDNGSTIKFKVDYKFLIEFYDANGDGAFQHNETVMNRVLSLESANWSYNIVGPYNDTEKGTVIDVVLYTTGWMSEAGDYDHGGYYNDSWDGKPDMEPLWWENVSVRFVLHLYQNTVNETLDNITYTVDGGLSLKIDFEVSEWPFLSMEDSLAVGIFIEDEAVEEGEEHQYKEEHRFRLEMKNESIIIDPESVGNQTLTQLEHKFRERMEYGGEEIIEFVNMQNVTHGYFKWVNKALVINETTDETSIVDVNASFICDGEALRLYLSYPAFNGTLVHDPTIGITETTDVPGNNPPSILEVIYPESLTIGEQLTIKIKVTDDYGIDSVKIELTAPDGTKFSYFASYNSDDGYYYLTLDTSDWQTGTWVFAIEVKDIYGVTTESQEYQVTITTVATTGEPTGEEPLTGLLVGDPYLYAGILTGILAAIGIIIVLRKRH